MERRVRIAWVCLLLAACGGAPAPVTTTASTASTRRHVGDYVVYRYAGRVIGPDPMLLMEEVVSQEGDRIVIEATLTRGHETVRAWRETVIDTEESRVEAVCQLEGETCTPLANEGDADLLRMYEGLSVHPDAPATDVTESDAPIDVGGTEMTCHVRLSSITSGGEAMTMKEYECPEFPWGSGGVLVEYPDKRRVLYVTVQSFG